MCCKVFTDNEAVSCNIVLQHTSGCFAEEENTHLEENYFILKWSLLEYNSHVLKKCGTLSKEDKDSDWATDICVEFLHRVSNGESTNLIP